MRLLILSVISFAIDVKIIELVESLVRSRKCEVSKLFEEFLKHSERCFNMLVLVSFQINRWKYCGHHHVRKAEKNQHLLRRINRILLSENMCSLYGILQNKAEIIEIFQKGVPRR